MALDQFLGAGAVALITGVITALVTYRQATKVAATEASAQVGVKRLENDGAAQNLWHDDLKDARAELKAEREAHLECIRTCATLGAENKRLTDCATETTDENAELKRQLGVANHELAQLQTAKMGWDFFQTSPAILRKMADDVERQHREGGPPGGELSGEGN